MESDIKLDSNNLHLEADFLHVHAVDIILDNPTRRKNPEGMRRALVHDFNDGLTINWAKDYPGGVTMEGIVTIPARLKVANMTIDKIVQTTEMVSKTGLGGVVQKIPTLKLTRTPVDLGIVIGELLGRIDALEKTVSELKAKVK